MGQPELKHPVHFYAIVAGRYNLLVPVFWGRIKTQNKLGEVFVVAYMHKSLAIAFGVLRTGKPVNTNQ